MHPELFCTKDYAKIHMDIKFTVVMMSMRVEAGACAMLQP